jgi:hypothetical protein
MFKQIFANRYAALVWVGLSLFAAAAFVSDGGGVDRLGETAQRLKSQQEAVKEPEAEYNGEPDAAEPEEEPAIEPSESATPEAGDVVTGEDGRRYRVVGTESPSAPAN